jgi:hypothetical protein
LRSRGRLAHEGAKDGALEECPVLGGSDQSAADAVVGHDRAP